MDIKDLKAAAYDTLAQIEALRARLGQINDAIAKESQKPKEEKVEEAK